MVLAELRDGLYNVVLLLHIVSVIAAFAPAVVNPPTSARSKREGGEAGLRAASKLMAENSRTIHVPALLAVAVFGVLMVLLSDDAWGFDQTWVWGALVLWFVLSGIISGVVVPAERAVAGGDVDAEKRVAAGGAAATVLGLVILYLMIWKPGL